MRLRTLIDNLDDIELVNIEGFMSEIEGISYNSKKTQPGDMFICLTGEHVDGHEYAEEAVTNGACLCIVERRLALDIPQIVVADTTEAIAQISDLFYQAQIHIFFPVNLQVGTDHKHRYYTILDQLYYLGCL